MLFQTSTSVQVIALILSSIAITCSTKRRLTDSNLAFHWLYVPGGVFLLTASLIISFQGPSIFWLSLISLAVSAILLTYPSKKNYHYVLGYAGPIDLNSHSRKPRQKIEPSFASDINHLESYAAIDQKIESTRQYHAHGNTSNHQHSIDIGELIREKLLNNKNAVATTITLVVLITVAMLITYLMSLSNSESPAKIKTETIEQTNEVEVSRQNRLAMPDDFELYTTPFEGIIISWQADSTNKKEIWNIRQAIGDKSCESITFNSGSKYRAIQVSIESQEYYFAEFSPLDTKDLLQDIAKRNKFTLCGYSFSLNGSQAVMGKHSYYGEKLSQ